MVDLPDPPIESDVILTDFAFMPLNVAQLRQSKAWLICKRRPELAFFMMNLWTAAWHETPAGSLEDDDDVLADRAMCPPKEWSRLRDDVLRGWVKCNDGRLYHKIVVEKAAEAWRSKLDYAYNKECQRLAKAAQRAKQKDFVPPTFDAWNFERLSKRQIGTSLGRPSDNSGRLSDVSSTSIHCPADFALKGSKGRVKGEVRDIHTEDTRPEDTCLEDTSGTGSDDEALVKPPCEVNGSKPPTGLPPNSVGRGDGREGLTEAENMTGFERVIAAYPKPDRFFRRDLAERNCLARIHHNNETWESLEARAAAYSAYKRSGGIGHYNPENFFEGDGGPWTHDWKPIVSTTPAESRQATNIENGLKFLAIGSTEP